MNCDIHDDIFGNHQYIGCGGGVSDDEEEEGDDCIDYFDHDDYAHLVIIIHIFWIKWKKKTKWSRRMQAKKKILVRAKKMEVVVVQK